MKISTILNKIKHKQLFIPAFQREYVWKRDNAKQLIDSLIKEYPIGTILTWETLHPPEFKGPHKYTPEQGAVKMILDGQQRITTLYMLIRGDVPPYYSLSEITSDTRGLYVNLRSLDLSYYIKMRMQSDSLWQNITDVFKGKVDAVTLMDKFNKDNLRDDLRKVNDNINTIKRIQERDFPEQIIPTTAHVQDAIDIFYKVNASGIALTDAELALAQISGYWPKARERFKAKLAVLKKGGFIFKLDLIIYTLLGCLYHGAADMRKLHSPDNDEKIRAAWKQLESQVLDYVVNMLRAHAYVDHTSEINSPFALVPIIVYCFDKNNDLKQKEIKKMVKWFFYSQVKKRYASQTTQKLDEDLYAIKTSPKPFDALMQNIEEESRLEIRPSDFVGSGVQHPLLSMMRWYFKSCGAICLTTGVPLRQSMGEKFQLEWDHIFPYPKLRERGYTMGNRLKYALAQELTNRAILSRRGSQEKSSQNTEDYLAQAKQKFPEALKLQCIPEDRELWKIKNYEKFLEKRRGILAEHLNRFLDGITTTDPTVIPVSIKVLIDRGESGELEFKSTLCWDIKEEKRNKEIEKAVMKTVSAFANSDGGTALIGVNDEGGVLGLEADYRALDDVNRDKFQLHLQNLLNSHFGEAFVARKITIKFHEIEEKEICRIEVKPSDKPVFLTTKGGNSQPMQKFYVRIGNSSYELPPQEMILYIKDHFQNLRANPH